MRSVAPVSGKTRSAAAWNGRTGQAGASTNSPGVITGGGAMGSGWSGVQGEQRTMQQPGGQPSAGQPSLGAGAPGGQHDRGARVLTDLAE